MLNVFVGGDGFRGHWHLGGGKFSRHFLFSSRTISPKGTKGGNFVMISKYSFHNGEDNTL